MALSQRLDLRQSQSLVMTPQLQQAIKLLQLSNIELTAYVEEQLEQNPLLERQDDPNGATGDGGNGEAADGEARDPVEAPAAPDPVADLDVDYETVWDSDGPGDGAPMPAGTQSWGETGGSFDDREAGVENLVSDSISLRDHLLGQLNIEMTDPADRLIGSYLIDSLDEAGYLRIDLGEAASQLGCDLERVEAILGRLQRFDPAGIFARNLSECLAQQLRERNRLDPAMQALLDNLDVLARRDYPALRRLCNVDLDDLSEMVAEIKALQPKPAAAFDHVTVQTVVPDIFMRPDSAGGWIVELNSETLPRVLINARYHAHVRQGAAGKADRDYIAEQYSAATWLVKALHQRATTILRVASEIVRRQHDFFDRGVQYLRPLILRDIAEAVAMHESTVSRVTSNKYIATPRGLFELKYFFTTAIASSEGGPTHSAESVRHRIRALIDAEQPPDVLSDDKLVDILKSEGVDIARRTVAKYREALHIPSSLQRRREKMSELQ
jgi:RNA polymerase sigma-54 factor